jgi:hypothetical protein
VSYVVDVCCIQEPSQHNVDPNSSSNHHSFSPCGMSGILDDFGIALGKDLLQNCRSAACRSSTLSQQPLTGARSQVRLPVLASFPLEVDVI